MPDALTGYPRWQGEISKSPRFLTIARHEIRRATDDQWGRTAIYVAIGYAIISVGTLYAARSNPAATSMDAFLTYLALVRWTALGIAAVMVGPALLEDAQHGALELYLSRALNRRDYLLGKTLAVFGLTLVLTWIPALFYIGGSYLVVDKHPALWAWAPLGSLGYAAIWAFVVSGIGLGLSCVVRSARAATLILFGGIAILDIILTKLLEGITRDTKVDVISPLGDLQQQVVWLFPGSKAPYAFPWWWGLIALGAIAALGWGLVALRHPRLKGVE
ncbi:MAG: ABC transporter permease subunit [Candidatus Thermoplasmatota archaeon]